MIDQFFTQHLRGFIVESNRIEGIRKLPVTREIEATAQFLKLDQISIVDLTNIVKVYQPDAVLRDKDTLNVRVGNYIAPKGGLSLVSKLSNLLDKVNCLRGNYTAIPPWQAHVDYEVIHPYSDGNGRSGRILWAWCMLARDENPFDLPFLHKFYYQTLQNLS